jgi:hypothetical protein
VGVAIEEHLGKAGVTQPMGREAMEALVTAIVEEKLENLDPSPEWLPDALRVSNGCLRKFVIKSSVKRVSYSL